MGGVSKLSKIVGFLGMPVVLTLVGAGCGKEPVREVAEPSRPVKTIVVQRQEKVFDRSFPARVNPAGQAELSFSVSGKIAEIPVKSGQPVKAGDVLARLDTRDLENALASAQAAYNVGLKDLEVLKKGARPEEIAELEAQVAAAAAQRKQSQTEYERAKELFDSGLISKNDFDRSSTQRNVVGSNVDSISQTLARARAGARPEEIQGEEARVAGLLVKVEQARAQLGDAVLKAPFDGVVAFTQADAFQEVQAKQAVLTLQNNSGFELKLDVPESLARRSNKGAETKFLVSFPDQPDKAHEAVFKSYSTVADPQTQTYELTLAMDAPEGMNLLAGMTAQVRIVSRLAEGVENGPVLLPVQAVAGSDQGGAHVWVVDTAAMRTARREVKTGAISGDMIEVTEGLKDGETVVTAGVSQVREGMAVTFMGE